MPDVPAVVVHLRIEPFNNLINTVHTSSASIGEFGYTEDHRLSWWYRCPAN